MSRMVIKDVSPNPNTSWEHCLYHVYDGEKFIGTFMDPKEAALCKAGPAMLNALMALRGAAITMSVTIDGEWGHCRNARKLAKDKALCKEIVEARRVILEAQEIK